MSTATISFRDPEEIRTLFGAQDRYLKQVRERVGIDVVIRGDGLHLQGEPAQIERGKEVLEELRSIVRQKGQLTDGEVDRVLLGAVAPATEGGSPIELNGRAKQVRPLTVGQTAYTTAIKDKDLVLCTGPAGTGKTYLAVAMALQALRQERVRKLVLVRPAVEAGERLGFLPGDMLAKVNPYLRPLLDALADILDYEQVKRYMEHDVVEIVPLAYMRGRTLNNTFIILDEGQNTTVTQMKMFLTRMGHGSKIVVTGDDTQSDLPEHVKSGLTDATRRLANIDGIAVVHLTGRDIVRHKLVREIVKAYDDENRRKHPR